MLSLPRRWAAVHKPKPLDRPKLTKEASTSMEDLSLDTHHLFTPGSVIRPKSMCIPLGSDPFTKHSINSTYLGRHIEDQKINKWSRTNALSQPQLHSEFLNADYWEGSLNQPTVCGKRTGIVRSNNLDYPLNINRKKGKMRRNPVQRAASRLYKASNGQGNISTLAANTRDCVGPEFVVRAALPSKELMLYDCKGNVRKVVTVIRLNGQKLDVTCNPNTTTAGQLFEVRYK